MKYKHDKMILVSVLLAMTLALMVFGFLSQSLGNDLAEGIYTHHMISYWGRVLLLCMGSAFIWKELGILGSRYPYIYKRIQTVILLVLLVFNVYVAVLDVLSNLGWNRHGQEDYIYALQQSNLIGRTEHMETLLPALFWRWERDAVLPALSLGYGILTVFVYIWVCWMFLFCAWESRQYLQGEVKVDLCTGAERLLRIDLSSIVYLSAVLTLIPMLIGQISPLLDLTFYDGGILFAPCNVAYLSFDPTETGILQFLTMAYLLCPPCTTVQEEQQTLLSHGEMESTEESSEEATSEETAKELSTEPTAEEGVAETVEVEAVPETKEPAEAPEEAVMPRVLNMEDFQKAEFKYIYADWDDEYGFPYFYVDTGWYYLTGGMARPELMKEGKSIYVGEGDFLKKIDPNTPEQGICRKWK